MAKKMVKKTTKKKATKRKTATREVSKPKNMVARPMNQVQVRTKMPLLIKNIILFAILFVLSLVLYAATSVTFYEDLFFMAALIFGFLLIAFVIALLILLIIRYSRR